MTVAAVILAASPESALADAEGVASVRRIADVAWAGGATPIVVVSSDPEGAVAAALAGAPVTLAEPAPIAGGPAGQMARGIEVATDLVRETGAALMWPASMTWVDAETVTSLIEAHGLFGDMLLRPSHDDQPGWPLLLPLAGVEALRRVAADALPPEIADELAARMAVRVVEVGDPGVVNDRSIGRSELPAFVGPSEPPGGYVHEWGAIIAEEPDDGPLEGPALAPYDQAADPSV